MKNIAHKSWKMQAEQNFLVCLVSRLTLRKSVCREASMSKCIVFTFNFVLSETSTKSSVKTSSQILDLEPFILQLFFPYFQLHLQQNGNAFPLPANKLAKVPC
ncbi:hypothetical protein T11_16047 [Trichinella zimbabwensis]|uniref:Uncharacterized protein n=1 Tax=Trichinella zimbabwensis TaxID=268475 RepID=A0A0V1HTN7_9BILA|nr:hypothetical protein T11_16047 [Trichinella zimbabwensis]